MKLFARTGSGTVIGGVVVAPKASDLILPIALAVEHRLTVDQLARAFSVYPSLSARSPTPRAPCTSSADDLRSALFFQEFVRPMGLEYRPGAGSTPGSIRSPEKRGIASGPPARRRCPGVHQVAGGAGRRPKSGEHRHMDVHPIVDRYGGIATRAQILQAGASGGDITRAVRLGEVRRLRRAHYSTPDASFPALAAVRVGGRLAGLSAAASYGLWGGTDSVVHIAVAPNASRLRTDFAPSSGRALSPDLFDPAIELHWVAAPSNAQCWRVSLESALIQVAQWSGREDAIACLDTASAVA